MNVRTISERLQLDRPLAYALAERVWQTLTGPVTVWLMIWKLSEETTGLYTGIGGVIGIQNLFELGMLNVLIGHAGHASAAIRQSESNTSDDDSLNPSLVVQRRRMKTLIDASGRWFAIAGLLFAVVAIAWGWFMFTRTEKADVVSSPLAWAGPLVVVVPMAAMIVCLSPRLAILEGSGKRELIYRYRLYQRLTGTFAVWGGLLAGIGIWALVLSTFVQLIWTIYVPFLKCREFFARFQSIPAASDGAEQATFSWRTDVLPAQWRAALVSMAHYFATQHFLFILLVFESRSETGRLGMTLMITTAIQAVALAWVQTKFSVISDHHGDGRREEAGTMWRRTAIISTGLLVAGFAALIGILSLLPAAEDLIETLGFRRRMLVTRFVTPVQCLILGIGCLASHLVGLQAIYVLARKSNPLTLALMIGSLSATAAVWTGGAVGATTGLLTGYAAAMSLIALPVHTWAYKSYRQR